MVIAQVEQIPPNLSQLLLEFAVPMLELLVPFSSFVHLSLQPSLAESRSCYHPAKSLGVLLQSLYLDLLVRDLLAVVVLGF